MSIFKKKEEFTGPIPVDENGKVIEAKPKGKVKGIVKKVLIGAGCLFVGVLTFAAVGVAMSNTGENFNGSIDFNPDINPCASNNADSNETSDEEKSEGSDEQTTE